MPKTSNRNLARIAVCLICLATSSFAASDEVEISIVLCKDNLLAFAPCDPITQFNQFSDGFELKYVVQGKDGQTNIKTFAFSDIDSDGKIKITLEEGDGYVYVSHPKLSSFRTTIDGSEKAVEIKVCQKNESLQNTMTTCSQVPSANANYSGVFQADGQTAKIPFCECLPQAFVPSCNGPIVYSYPAIYGYPIENRANCGGHRRIRDLCPFRHFRRSR